ncbi:MAG: MarR family winged helix-turn-helix transcriptional regulator [Candidatus Limnocylindrales bacterium]
MTTPSLQTTERAAAVWRRIFDFIVATAPLRISLLAGLGLTPNDSRALYTLSLSSEGQTMRSLAAAWECDASTVTWTVDRLEAKGLAERRSHPTDRRVRLVFLTAHGVEVTAEIAAGTYAPPAALLALPDDDLLALQEAVALLPTDAARQLSE